MLSTLFTILKTIAVVGLASIVYKQTNPQRYEDMVVSVSYSAIYMFSRCQILAGKLSVRINVFINANPWLKTIITNIYKTQSVQNQICQILAGNICVKNYTTDDANYFEHNDAAFYVFVDNARVSESGCVNHVVIRSPPFSTKYDLSSMRFLLCEVKVRDKFYKINLAGANYNYYVVNNIIDRRFLLYFMKQYQIYNFTEDEMCNTNSFTVKTIDQNVNVTTMEITDDQFITIKKTDYTY